MSQRAELLKIVEKENTEAVVEFLKNVSKARIFSFLVFFSKEQYLSYQLMRSLVTSIFLYAFELWTLTAELQRRTQAMEMRCYCKILRISYKDHVTNEEVHAMFQ